MDDAASRHDKLRRNMPPAQTVREQIATEREPGVTIREPSPTLREQRATVRESSITTREPGTTTREPIATERESGATVRESSSSHSDPMPTMRESRTTVREVAQHSSATMKEGIGIPSHPSVSQPRVNIPYQVNRIYQWVRDLNVSGGESDLSLIRHRETGQTYFFKHYHVGKYPDEGVLKIVRDDPDKSHVVDVVDFSSDHRDAWEIQEYCELGSLEHGSWVNAFEGQFDEATIKEVLREVSEAIHHIHTLGTGVAHRDIKPSNILVRSDDPLDLVLTDFGIARDNQQGTYRTTFAGTNLYAAPETHEELSSKESDWFALGAIIFELLQNQQLLARWGHHNPSDEEARTMCLARGYYDNVEHIDDDRWSMLVKGLVTSDRNYRWGYNEIQRWFDGEEPDVFWAKADNFAGISPEECFQPSWSSELIALPDKLARSMGTHWEDAKKALVGREREDIEHFLGKFSQMDDAINIIRGTLPLDRKLLKLQLLLDGQHPPVFINRELTDQTIRSAILDAERGNKSALDWLMAIIETNALTLLCEHNAIQNADKVARSAQDLKTWYDQAEQVKSHAPEKMREIADNAFKEALPSLFTIAFKDEDYR